MNTEHRSSGAIRRAVHEEEMKRNVANLRVAFSRKGIPDADIEAGKTVFSFNMWRALGRTVKRGEHGVLSLCLRNIERLPDTPERKVLVADVSSTTVFHISQTAPWRPRAS